MDGIRPPRACGSHLAGHTPHWIQAGHAAADGYVAVDRVEVRDDGVVLVEVGGARHRGWNHDPERLRQALAVPGVRVSMSRAWSLLRVGRGGGGLVVSLSARPDPRPCPPRP